MRKHWLDNLRWVTVLLVLFYHVIYFYNNKGVFGGIGGFGEYPEWHQYQDVVMYILYPWFMPLLFILAGISARYALEKYPAGKWFGARTRKLLVPGTIGLFVFHWMVGYFNTAVAARTGAFEGMPGVAKYVMMAISGTGPLWFIQDLWLFSLLLLLVRRLDLGNRFHNWCGRLNIVWIILLGVIFSMFASSISSFIITFAGEKVKSIMFCWVWIWVRWTLPRFRYDHIMHLGWKIILNIAILNLVVTAVVAKLLGGN